MNKHTIAFICPSTAWGGLEMNVHRLAVWLTKRGHRIILYGNPASELYNKCRANNIETRPLVSRSKFRDIFIARKLARMLRQDNARIVMLHMNKNFLLTALAKRFSGGFFKFAYMQQMHVGPSKKDFYHNWLYRHLDIWIAPLPFLQKAALEKTAIPPEKFEIIPHGIDIDPFTTRQPDKPSARGKLNLPENVLVAGVIGRLDPKKGQHILIEACHKLRQKGHQLNLLFVGDSSAGEQTGYDTHLRQLVDEYGLTSQTYFRPFLAAVEYAFASLDIFVLTSRSETYGLVTLEAMASGLPVVGTREGGTPDIITDGVTGLLVDPFDSDQLAGALTRLITDRPLAEKLACAARAEATARYSYQHQCDLLERLFERLTG